MLGRLLNLLTVLSLLLCVAVCVLWVRSYRVGDWITHTDMGETSIGFGSHVSALPHWFVVLLSAALPGWRLYKHRWRHSRPGLCAACGYDLRATPQRGPECGRIAATPSVA